MFKIIPESDVASKKMSISFEGVFPTQEYSDAFKKFVDVYEVDNLIMDGDRKPNLKPKNQRVCRFCDKAMPNVTFRKDAHSLSQLMGNRNIVSDAECDTCNHFFSKYENDLASFMGLSRTLSFLKGQNGIPKYKSPDKNLIIGENDEDGEDGEDGENKANKRLKLTSFGLENDHFKVDEDDKTLLIKGTKHPYTPLKVFKLLAKIGYSLLPEDELSKFQTMRKVIMSEEFDNKVNGNPLFRLFEMISPGPPFPSPMIFSCKKKAEHQATPCPTWTYVIYFQNYIYQFFLPYYDDDYWIFKPGGTVTILRMPPLLDKKWIETFGEPSFLSIDLSSNIIKKNEPQYVTMQFDEAIMYPNPISDNSASEHDSKE